jgi:AcrR family transcriptional regulator
MDANDPVRARLLATARDLFSAKGFEETSVREITAAAGANLGAITYHFGSKEALYLASIESVADPLVDAVAAASMRSGSAVDRLEAVVRAVLGHLSSNSGAPRILLRELAGDRPIPAPMASAMRRNLGVLMQVITDGQREGTIRSGDPVLLALSVVAQPFFISVAGRLIREAFDVDRDDPAIRDRVVEHVVESVRRLVEDR